MVTTVDSKYRTENRICRFEVRDSSGLYLIDFWADNSYSFVDGVGGKEFGNWTLNGDVLHLSGRYASEVMVNSLLIKWLKEELVKCAEECLLGK